MVIEFTVVEGDENESLGKEKNLRWRHDRGRRRDATFDGVQMAIPVGDVQSSSVDFRDADGNDGGLS